MIRCQACGTENPDGASYCSTCARKLDDATQAAVVQQRESHTATNIRWSAIAITVFIILLVALLVALLALHVVVL